MTAFPPQRLMLHVRMDLMTPDCLPFLVHATFIRDARDEQQRESARLKAQISDPTAKPQAQIRVERCYLWDSFTTSRNDVPCAF